MPELRGRLWSAELGAPAPSQMGGRCATNGPKVLRRDAYESSVRFPRLRGSLLTRPKASKARSSESGQGQVGSLVEASITSKGLGTCERLNHVGTRRAPGIAGIRDPWAL